MLWIGFDLQAEIEAVGDYNWTALRFAAMFGEEAVAAQLLQAGASVSAVNHNNLTPLHTAALHGRSSIANLLLQANGIPTAVDKKRQNSGAVSEAERPRQPRGEAAGGRASRSLKVRADSAGHPSTLYAAKLF